MEIVKFALEVLAVLGGAASIAALLTKKVAKTCVDIFMNRLQERSTKRIEGFKAELNNKTYVTQKRYDKEYEEYISISNKISDIVGIIQELFPRENPGEKPSEKNKDISSLLSSKEKRDPFGKKSETLHVLCMELSKKIYAASYIFIDEEQMKKFENLLEMIEKQIANYDKLIDTARFDNVENKTKEIYDEWAAINSGIRAYFLSLELV